MNKLLLTVCAFGLLLSSASAHAGAESIEYWKCGPYNIRIDRAADNGWGVSFDTTKGKEVRRDQYNFIREKKAQTNDESKFAFWSGVRKKGPHLGMAGTLETSLANGRTTYTEEVFTGADRTLSKVVKTCTAGKAAAWPRR